MCQGRGKTHLCQLKKQIRRNTDVVEETETAAQGHWVLSDKGPRALQAERTDAAARHEVPGVQLAYRADGETQTAWVSAKPET